MVSGNHFLNAVIRGEKVFLFGDQDELRKMGGVGWLKREPTSRDEIEGLLSIVDRGLVDSKVEAISTDLISDLSRRSIPRLRLQQRHFGPLAFVHLAKPDIMSRRSNLSILPSQTVEHLSKN